MIDSRLGKLRMMYYRNCMNKAELYFASVSLGKSKEYLDELNLFNIDEDWNRLAPITGF